MLDDDLRRLNEGALDHSLDGLESDIWARLAARSQNRAVARRRVSLQSVVMVLALVGSIAIGIHSTRLAGPPRGRAVLALGLELAPSSLLLGNAQ
jgi:hypothetical protein